MLLGVACLTPRVAQSEEKTAGTDPKKSASATRGPKAAPPSAPANVTAIAEKLRSGPSDVRAGLTEAKAAGKSARSVAPAVEELLRAGTNLELTGLALSTLAEIGDEANAAAILPYARHRVPELRKAALSALTRLRGAQARAALREALSDSDAGVRGVAAGGLGALKATEATADLFVALDHNVPEAASSLGLICTAEPCEKLVAKLGTLRFDVIVTGLDAILARPAGEVSDEFKIRLVERVRDLRSEPARNYLRDLQARWHMDGSRRVKQAIDQALIASSGSPP